MNNNYAEMSVLATLEGDHYHIFDDCRALAQGRRNSVKFGRELSLEGNLTAEDAIDDGYFACRVCHNKAGLDLPAEADRKAIRASRKAGRARTAERVARDAAAKARTERAKAERLRREADRMATKATEAKRPATIESRVAEAQVLAAQAELATVVADSAAAKVAPALDMASVMARIAAVYATNGNDKVRWDAATLRNLPVAV